MVASVECSVITPFLFFVTSLSVSAHEVRPAYLELRQTGTETYDVLWKVPARGDNMRLGIYVEFPSGHDQSYAAANDICQRCFDRALEYKTTRRIDRRRNPY